LRPDGEVLLSVGGDCHSIQPELLVDLRTMRNGQVVRSNLYLEQEAPGERHPLIHWVVPMGGSAVQGILPVIGIALIADAHDFVFPLAHNWPTASPSGETLLVRQVGDRALFVNDLWHQSGMAMRLAPSMTTADFPAATALRASSPGVYDGVDYRGERVRIAYRPVVGTDWRVVAKLDQAEVFIPLYRLVAGVAAVAFVAVLVLSVGLYYLWVQHERLQSLADIASRGKEALERETLTASARASQERAEMLIETALDAVVSMDEAGTIIGWNAQAEPIFGHAAEEALGKDLTNLIVPHAYRDAHRAGLARYLHSGEARILGKRIEVIGLRSDSTTFPMELTISKLQQNGHHFFTAYIRDISDRKRAEAGSRALLERMTTVFNSSPVAASISVLDDGTFLQINRNISRDFGWTEADLIGRSSVEVGLWQDPHDREAVLVKLENHGRLTDHNAVWCHKDGTRHHVSLSAKVFPLRGPVLHSHVRHRHHRAQAQ